MQVTEQNTNGSANESAIKETIVGLMNAGAEEVTVKKASTYEEFTVDQLEKMHDEEGLGFDYNIAEDSLTITKE